MRTERKTTTEVITDYIFTKEEIVTLLIKSGMLPKNSTNIIIGYSEDMLSVRAEEKIEKTLTVTHEQTIMLNKSIRDLSSREDHPLSFATQKTLQRHGFKTLQSCLNFTKEGLLKKTYFPKKTVRELENFFKEENIPFD